MSRKQPYEVKVYLVTDDFYYKGRYYLVDEYIALSVMDAVLYEDCITEYIFDDE